MLKPKVGDLVRLKPMKITGFLEDENRYSIIQYGGYWFSVAENEIEEILPRPLAVGDRVSFTVGILDRSRSMGGEIAAVRGSYFWVLRDDGMFATLSRDELTCIDSDA